MRLADAGGALLVIALVLSAIACSPREGAPVIARAERGSLRATAKQQTAPSPAPFAPCPAQLPDGMACIPGGSFVRGDDGDPHASPAETITVSTFLLDTREVTNAQWSECVSSGECRRLMPFRGYLGDEQPVVAMRWDEAQAFCARRGARLPSEAEWERAASGPDDTRYPWGDEPGAACEHAIVRTREGRGCGRDATWPVASRPAFGFGLHDMAGNVWEWVADAYAPCYRGCDRACGDACGGRDPRGPCGGAAECPE
ncbi:MAG: formylglycine-generating enzyme family protein, partial [Myxococcota bacterium]|nr:formylglycine-generating enzyme family protein [Myxococcota bacterium]